MSSPAEARTALDPRPKPWIIALNIDPASQLGQLIDGTGGTVRFVHTLGGLRLDDFEFLFVDGPTVYRIPSHMSVLQFLPVPGHNGESLSSPSAIGNLTMWVGASAERFESHFVLEDIGLKTLVDETVMRHIPLGGSYTVLGLGNEEQKKKIVPLVSELDGSALALTTAYNSGRSWWLLPSFTTSRHKWAQALLERWRQKRPDAFPPPSIGAQRMWQTAAEQQALDSIEGYEAETKRLIDERAAELARLQEDAELLQRTVDQNERLVLTTTGTELEQAVASTLTTIGFTVQDSDVQAAAAGKAKRQDLEVTSATAPQWVALVEVKGYPARSAKASDIAQLQRAAGFYESANDCVPDSLWYVVNANFGKDPNDRAVPLASSGEDVEDFANDGGAVIDTRQLFLLAKAVEAGACTSEAAQQSLIAATGIYSSPHTLIAGESSDK